MTISQTRASILGSLKRVAGARGSLTRQQYRSRKRNSDPASSTIEKYFGNFSTAIRKAKLS